MSVRRNAATRPERPGAAHLPDRDSRIVGVSKRVWAAFAVLTLLLVVAGAALISSRSKVADLTDALREAELKARESGLALEHALADKQQVLKELAAQGDRLAEFSRGEEKAKSELEHASTGAEAAEKRVSDLRKRLARAEKNLAEARRTNAALQEEIATLLTALDGTRAELEQASEELKRLRSEAAPYSQPPGQDRRQGQ